MSTITALDEEIILTEAPSVGELDGLENARYEITDERPDPD